MPATSSAAARPVTQQPAAGDEGGDRDQVRTAGADRRERQDDAARGRGSAPSRSRRRTPWRSGSTRRALSRAARQSGRRPGHGAERPADPERSGSPTGLSRDEGRGLAGRRCDRRRPDRRRQPAFAPVATDPDAGGQPGLSQLDTRVTTGGQRTGGGTTAPSEPGTVDPAADPRRAAAAPGFRHPQDHAGDHPGPRAGAAADTDHPAARGRRAVAAGGDARCGRSCRCWRSPRPSAC